MNKESLGEMIMSLRKERGMTQLELAEKMGVTDKAVSKWERDLSCPDINSIPRLAEVLNVSVEELMQSKREPAKSTDKTKTLVELILKAVALAMGVAAVVLSSLKAIDVYSGFAMLGIGLTALGLAGIKNM